MSSRLQLDVPNLSLRRRHLVNADEVKAGIGVLQVKLCDPCLSALRVLQKWATYKLLPLPFYLYFICQLCIKLHFQRYIVIAYEFLSAVTVVLSVLFPRYSKILVERRYFLPHPPAFDARVKGDAVGMSPCFVCNNTNEGLSEGEQVLGYVHAFPHAIHERDRQTISHRAIA